MRHFLTLKDYTKAEILEIIDLAIAIKKEAKAKTAAEIKPEMLSRLSSISNIRMIKYKSILSHHTMLF